MQFVNDTTKEINDVVIDMINVQMQTQILENY